MSLPVGFSFDAPVAMLIGGPLQWGFLAFIVVLVFAPRLLPPLGRLAGFALGQWLRVRLGLPAQRPRRRTARPQTEEQEVLPPEHAGHTLRAGSRVPLWHAQQGRRQTPLWLVVTIVTSFVAVLSWYLLHTR